MKEKKARPRIKDRALDAGTTEVYTDQNNRRDGSDFGRIPMNVDVRVTDTGKKRTQIRDTATNTACATKKAGNAH